MFKNKENIEISYLLRKELEKTYPHLNIISKTYASLFSESFLAKEGILAEGWSLIYKKDIARGLGYQNYMLFKYTLKGFTQSKRMQFQYSLWGRNKKGGIIKELALMKFSDGILLSPVSNGEKTKKYLSFWNISFEEMPVLLPSRIKI